MAATRFFVEKKKGFDVEAQRLCAELRESLQVFSLRSLRIVEQYDVEDLPAEAVEAVRVLLCDSISDIVSMEEPEASKKNTIVSLSPLQFIRRADATAQCLQLMFRGNRPVVACARIYLLEGNLDADALAKTRNMLQGGGGEQMVSAAILTNLDGFAAFSARKLAALNKLLEIDLLPEELACCQTHFRDVEHRDPTPAEVQVIAAYWSQGGASILDASLEDVKISEAGHAAPIAGAWKRFLSQKEPNGNVSLREIMRSGAEADTCALTVGAQVEGARVPWRVRLYGGASAVEALHKPLCDGMTPFQALHIGGYDALPSAMSAIQSYSDYPNRFGVPVSKSETVYHPCFAEKALALTTVLAAAPQREGIENAPPSGEAVLILGGQRKFGSAGTYEGDPAAGRGMQRLLDNPEFQSRVKRSTTIGAGGICAAAGKLARGVDIDLNAVFGKQNKDLDAAAWSLAEAPGYLLCLTTMRDVTAVMRMALAENLEATCVGHTPQPSANPRLLMRWNGAMLVNLPCALLERKPCAEKFRVRIAAPAVTAPEPLRLPEGVQASAPIEENWLRILSELNVSGQRRQIEQLDGSVGGGTVIAPLGGRYGATPNEAAVALLPAMDDCATLAMAAHGYDPALMAWSPYHGAVYAVVEAVSRIVAGGGDPAACGLLLHTLLPETKKDALRVGTLLSAALGAMDARQGLEISVVDTQTSAQAAAGIAAFALSAHDVHRIVTPELKGSGHVLAHFATPRDAAFRPDYVALRKAYAALHMAVRKKQVLAARTVDRGGLAAALSQMAFGNRIGVVLEEAMTEDRLFLPDWGGMVIELADGAAELLLREAETLPGFCAIGHTQEEPELRCGAAHISLAEAQAAWEAPHGAAQVFLPATPMPAMKPDEQRSPGKARFRTALPQACILCFPGTNGERDMARAFARAGSNVETVALRNYSAHALEESLRAMAAAIARAQIVALPGGFSAADEPGGAGKLMAAALGDPYVAEALRALLGQRDGLVLGIGNGFQALLRSGLLPYGDFCGQHGVALAVNATGAPVFTTVHTAVTSVRSPWLAGVRPGDVHAVPVSHREGRFVCDAAQLLKLHAAGQIVTRYCEPDGTPATRPPYNPNGSMGAAEGICSPDGRILGKMGHSERWSPGVGANLPNEQDQRLFASGVSYFS